MNEEITTVFIKAGTTVAIKPPVNPPPFFQG